MRLFECRGVIAGSFYVYTLRIVVDADALNKLLQVIVADSNMCYFFV